MGDKVSLSKESIEQVVSLSKKYSNPVSNLRALGIISIDLSIYAISILVSEYFANIFVYILCIILIGSRMRALNNLIHDCSHLRMGNKSMNWLISHACGLVVMISPSSYKNSHMAHHANFGEKNDPDRVRYESLGRIWNRNSKLTQKAFSVILLYMYYVHGAFSSFLFSTGIRKIAVNIVIFSCLIYFITILGYSEIFVSYWLIPFLTSFQIIRMIAEIGEHAGLYLPRNEIVNVSSKARAFAMTRNISPLPIVRFLVYPHGDGYHMLHHLCPAVPSPMLKHLHLELSWLNWYENNYYLHDFNSLFFSESQKTLYGSLSKHGVI